MTFTGVERGWALSSFDADGLSPIPGLTVHICHGGEGDGSAPADKGGHDCCDACALGAALASADVPVMVDLPPVEHVIAHSAAVSWAPVFARVRTPRLSQGPPTNAI